MTDLEKWARREDFHEEWTKFLGSDAAQAGLRTLASMARPVCVLTESQSAKASRLDYLAGFVDCIKQLQNLPLLGKRPEQSDEVPWEYGGPPED